MIARLWRGETRSADADAYQQVLEHTGVRDYQATPGNLGVWLLRRDAGARSAFALVTLWDRRASIEAFAGRDIAQARYYDIDREYLLEVRRTVEHFDVAHAWSAGDPGARAPRAVLLPQATEPLSRTAVPMRR